MQPRYGQTARPPRSLATEADSLVTGEEELVAGRRPVEEAFAAGREAHRLLVVPQRRQALERIVLHATNLRIPILEVEGGTLTAVAGFDGHQGIAVVVTPRRYATLDEILARAIERGEPPFVLALDSLEDPQNVGTLLRSAEAAGAHGVVFPTHRQAPLTPAAVKASAGAVEHLLLCPVDDLAAALADLHVRGLRVAGAEAEAPLTARQADLRGPLTIVVGSEGQGLGPAVRRRCDVLMRIPMQGVIESLNAAVAGSILLFEAVAQRNPEGLARPRPAARQRRPQTGVAPGAEQDAERPGADPAPDPAPTPDVGEPPASEVAPGSEATPVRPPRSAQPDGGRTDADAAEIAPAVPPSPAARPLRVRRTRTATGPQDVAVDAPTAPALAPEPPPPADAESDPAAAPGQRGSRRSRTSANSPGPEPAPSDQQAADDRPAGEESPARARVTRPRRTKTPAPSAARDPERPDDADDGLLPGGPQPAAPG